MPDIEELRRLYPTRTDTKEIEESFLYSRLNLVREILAKIEQLEHPWESGEVLKHVMNKHRKLGG